MYRHTFLPLLLSFAIITLPATASCNTPLIPVYQLLLLSGPDTNQKVFIIGDSTVHRHATPYLLNGAGMICGDDNPEHEQQGWGDGLSLYMTHPENSINKARQGASSQEFLTASGDDDLGPDRHWGSTEVAIMNAGGGILLIQFGSGNENRLAPVDTDYDGDGDVDSDDEVLRRALRETRFKQNIGFYINRARELNVLPILVTPPEGRLDVEGEPADGTHPDTRHPFPGYIHDLGDTYGVEVLDLHSKSNQEFAKYSDAKLLEQFGDCSYDSGYVDRVHYEPHGAMKVAGWVKELACDALNDKSLCAQFSTISDKVIPTISLNGSYYITLAHDEEFVDPGATAQDDVDGNITADIVVNGTVNSDVAEEYSITYDVIDSSANTAIQVTRIVRVPSAVVIHEDAEDGNTNGWGTYGTTEGSSVNNVADAEWGSRVIVLNGNNGLDNGFSLTELNINTGFVVSWSMKYSEQFRFFVKVRTSGHDPLYIYYTPDDQEVVYEFTDNKHYIHNGIGADAMAGNWMSFTRDIEADLQSIFPDETLELIIGFYIRGSGSIDDISTSNN